MRVHCFRLSGYDFRDDTAERMFAAILDHGFSRVVADLNPWPMRKFDGQYVCDVDVSGVSAHAELHFDDAASLIQFVQGAHLIQRSEDDATAAYRRLLAINDAFMREPQQEPQA